MTFADKIQSLRKEKKYLKKILLKKMWSNKTVCIQMGNKVWAIQKQKSYWYSVTFRSEFGLSSARYE